MTCSGRNLPVYVVRIQLSLCHFPEDAFYTRFLDQGTDVMKLNAVTEVYALLNHGCVQGAHPH
jgi:hypothetical protein